MSIHYQFCSLFLVDKTEALHKQSSLQVASSGISSVSSSIGVSTASSSSVPSPSTIYSYFMSVCFVHISILTDAGRHHSTSLLILLLLISFLNVSFSTFETLFSLFPTQDMVSDSYLNIFYLLS